jgi:predicted RNA binding protein YcfA (HicA-like mRNA interferase family)
VLISKIFRASGFFRRSGFSRDVFFQIRVIAAEAAPTECRGDFLTRFGALPANNISGLISYELQSFCLFLWFTQARYNSGMKVRALIRRLKDEGWQLDRRKGGHRKVNHPLKRGLVTVPGKPGDDLAPGTLSSIVEQAGWK